MKLMVCEATLHLQVFTDKPRGQVLDHTIKRCSGLGSTPTWRRVRAREGCRQHSIVEIRSFSAALVGEDDHRGSFAQSCDCGGRRTREHDFQGAGDCRRRQIDRSRMISAIPTPQNDRLGFFDSHCSPAGEVPASMD